MTDQLGNESDVEQKLLYPLLTASNGLAIPPSEIYTKQYIQSRSIGKRVSKKGYIPDYVIYSQSIPTVVIEAKSPSETVGEALREAAAYALEINSGFPPGINPIQWIIACNGSELAWAPWDSMKTASCITVEMLKTGLSEFERFRQALGSAAISQIALDNIKKLIPIHWFNPIRLAGVTPIQSRQRPLNRFASELHPLVAKFLAKDQGRDSIDIATRGYVTSDDRTEYEGALEALLKDSVSRVLRPDAAILATGVGAKSHIRDQIVPRRVDLGSTVTILIGGVGSGKSLFLDRFSHLHLSQMGGQVLWVLIDFNGAPEDRTGFSKWMLESFVKAAAAKFSDFGESIDSLDTLRKIFGRQIQRKRSVLTGGDASGAMSSEEFDKWIRGEIEKWMDDPELLTAGIFDHFVGERSCHVVAVFDNADKRGSQDQIAVFQEVLNFSGKYQCSAIIAIRDETFDLFARVPPLDAVSKHRVFRVEAPRLIDVLKKRIDMMIDYLEKNVPRTLGYMTSGGVRIEYPREDLRKYIRKVFDDLFSTQRRLRTLIEAVAGRDIRRALEMFSGIMVSPYLTDDNVGFGAQYQHQAIPEWTVLKALMRGRYAFYSDMRGEAYIHNILQAHDRSATIDNFIVPELLAILIRERKRTGELGVEGYMSSQRLMSSPELMGYADEDIVWAINYCYNAGLLLKELGDAGCASKYPGAVDAFFVKISASGFYHMKVLSRRLEYMANVAMSSWVRDVNVASEIADTLQVQLDEMVDSRTQTRRRYLRFASYLRSEAALHKLRASAQQDRLGGVQEVLANLESIEEHILRSSGPGLFSRK